MRRHCLLLLLLLIPLCAVAETAEPERGFGGFTYRKTSENPAGSFLDADQQSEKFGTHVALQFNVGHRF